MRSLLIAAAVVVFSAAAYADVSVGIGTGSATEASPSVMLDMKGVSLWKVFVGSDGTEGETGVNIPVENAASTGVLSYDAGKTTFPSFGGSTVGTATPTKQLLSFDSFGAFQLENGMGTLASGTAAAIIGSDGDTPTGDYTWGNTILKDTFLNVEFTALGNQFVWLQYQTIQTVGTVGKIGYKKITVPEPTALSLMGLAGAGLLARRRKA